METYRIAGHRYFVYNEIKAEFPDLCKGCRNVAMFKERNGVPDSETVYARYNKRDQVWKVTDGSGKSVDKFFVGAKWFQSQFSETGDDEEEDVDDAEETDDQSSEDESEDDSVPEQPAVKHVRSKYGKAALIPAKIVLKKRERFVGPDGKVMQIEVRGERMYGECFFSAKDAAREFGIKDLLCTIRHKDRGYIEGDDYCYFRDPNAAQIVRTAKQGNPRKHTIWLTYYGLMHVIFASRTPGAKPYMDWAAKTLFSAHMGNETERTKLASNLTGISPEAIKELSRANIGTMPCIYLYSLGKVADLREAMDLDASLSGRDCVYKWGYTNDLARRTREHQSAWREVDGVEIRLIYQCYIDVQFVAEAEACVREFFRTLEYGIEYSTHRELVVIPKRKLDFVREQYLMIGDRYLGRVRELVEEKRNMEQAHLLKIAEMSTLLAQMSTSLAQMEHSSLLKQTDLAAALSQKELEIRDLKIQMLEEKLKYRD